jgi:PAS domain S-box-containing protein
MSRAKILLVDDEPLVRDIYRHVLEHAGLQVVEAADHDSAISLFDHSVELALVDIVLEGKSGLEILSHIRKQMPLCPVIMISAHANKNNAIDALHKGAVDYLEKPINLRELVHVVERWLSHRTIEEENIRLREEQKLEHELRASELHYHQLIEAIPDAILIVCEGRIVYANTAASGMLNAADKDELIGRELLELAEPECRVSLADHIKHALQEQRSVTGQQGKLLKLNGEPVDVEFSIVHTDYLDQDAVQLLVRDISRRKKIEANLRESEEKFRSLSEQSPNMIFINQGSRVVFANPQCEKTMGYGIDEMCAPDFDFHCLVAPEHHNLLNANFTRHMQGEDVPPYECALITRGGDRLDSLVATRLINYGGSQSILGIITDITGQKQAEEKLRQSEARFRGIFENAAGGVVLASLDGRLLQVNGYICAMLGYAEDELLLKTFMDITHPDDLAKETKYYEKALAGELAHTSFEKRYIHRDGSFVWIQIGVSVMKDMHGKPEYFVGLIQDITGDKLAEEALQEQMRKLQRFNKMAVGRELRMIELKEEINALLVSMGEAKKYVIHSVDGDCDSEAAP